MILTVLIVAGYTALGVMLTVSVSAALYLAYLTWRDRQRDIGYGYGSIDGHRFGDAVGYSRGYSQAALNYVLTQPTEAQHYAGIVSAIPDAEHYADTVRMSAVRRSVQGKEAQS